MKTWRDQGLLADAAVWINLSHSEMQNQDLAPTIEVIVKEVDLDPGALAVEVTETWAMATPASVAGVIRCLQGFGIAVGINAFGTGYSALATRDRLAAHALKIDQSLVAGLPGDTVACAIVRAVITLARALGLRLIAEVIETRAQSDFLRHEGCGIGQGYLFSRPLPAAAFEAYVTGLCHGPALRVGGT